MKKPESPEMSFTSLLQRRAFVTRAGMLGAGAAAAMLGGSSLLAGATGEREDRDADDRDNTSGDTAQQIFTAALIAEDLATTFYYNGLVGPVIMDDALAGTGGSATQVATGGDEGNVAYIRAALSEEIVHADLLRALIGGKDATTDPVQTFYFPAGSFDKLGPFTALLDALENAFIGAYLNATLEFAQMAADTKSGVQRQRDASKKFYHSTDLEYFAQVSAAIMGIESEHRVLGRVISGTDPANQLNYEQTGGLTSVYNGKNSAVVALTPFLAPGAGKVAYSFQKALAGAPSVILPTTGGLPPAPAKRKDDDR
ncbi:MAG: ferritin-like domain-containing protein [Candidatus Acidiferrum sp.]